MNLANLNAIALTLLLLLGCRAQTGDVAMSAAAAEGLERLSVGREFVRDGPGLWIEVIDVDPNDGSGVRKLVATPTERGATTRR